MPSSPVPDNRLPVVHPAVEVSRHEYRVRRFTRSGGVVVLGGVEVVPTCAARQSRKRVRTRGRGRGRRSPAGRENQRCTPLEGPNMTVPKPDEDRALLEVVDELARKLGRAPGRDAVRAATGVGSPRASRLLKEWKARQGLVDGATQQDGSPGERGRTENRLSVVPTGATPHGPATGAGGVDQADSGEAGQATTEAEGTAGRAAWSARRVALTWSIPAGLVTLLVFGLAATSIGRQVLDWVGNRGPDRLIVTIGVAAAVAMLAVAVTTARRARPGRWSTRVLLLGAAVGVTVSGDTAWRFFEHYGQATSVGERIGIFAGVEVVLVGCGFAMHERAKAGDQPGQFRTAVWLLCGFSAFAALTLQGWPGGVYRVVGGPVVAVVALHLALGIEIRAARGGRKGGTYEKVAAELRERVLSRLGLGDDGRDALARTRHRAAIRAARLAYGGGLPFRRAARMRKALVVAGMADNVETRLVFESTLRLLQESEQWARLRRTPRRVEAE